MLGEVPSSWQPNVPVESAFISSTVMIKIFGRSANSGGKKSDVKKSNAIMDEGKCFMALFLMGSHEKQTQVPAGKNRGQTLANHDIIGAISSEGGNYSQS